MEATVDLLHTTFVTHDTRQFITTRPEGIDLEPGQGVELALDEDGWRDEGRPFTPTSPNTNDVLEFVIKAYPERDAVTARLHALEPGARLHVSKPFGSLKWAGPGTFIAAGAGVTPFLAMIREQRAKDALGDSALHFSNSTPADIICERELIDAFGDACHLTCTTDHAPAYDHRHIDRAYLEEEIDDFSGRFYVCGPEDFVRETREALVELGAEPESIIIEE
jgi:cytochrome-b5 reductase